MLKKIHLSIAHTTPILRLLRIHTTSPSSSTRFFFEKISCGSTRSFDQSRSIITDFVELRIAQSDVDELIREWRFLDPLASYFWEEDLMKAQIYVVPEMKHVM